jgi:AcrR family transcriptional regulator
MAIGRPREFDRDTALEAAMLLFWRKGFASTSMTDLCEAMNVRSPSLYAAFSSKEALYLEAMEHYLKVQGPLVWGHLATGETVRDGIENLLTAGAETLPKSRTAPAGCMAMLAAISDEWPNGIAKVARKIRVDMLRNLRSRLESAVANGELPATTDVDIMSRYYLGVFQGMAVQARDGSTSDELKGVVAAAMVAWPSAA